MTQFASFGSNSILFQSNGQFEFTSGFNPSGSDMNVTSGSSKVTSGSSKVASIRQPIPKRASHPIIDPKMCPTNSSICAYYSEGDLWVQDISKGADDVIRVTADASNNNKVFAGFPPYCILEEFDRYTGYYWATRDDTDAGQSGKIVYEVVDESDVNEFVSICPKSMATRLYRKSGHSKQLVSRNRHELPPWSGIG